MTQRRLGYAILLPLVLLALAGCQRSPGPSVQTLSMTATVSRGSMAAVVQTTGQVVAPNSQTVVIGSYGGRVLAVDARPGQTVVKGQVLLRLDTTGQERELREARADLKAAEAVLQEAQAIAGTAEIARAEADLAKAEAELAAAQLALQVSQEAGLTPLEEQVVDSQVALQLSEDQLRQAEYSDVQHQVRSDEYHLAFFQRMLRDLQG